MKLHHMIRAAFTRVAAPFTFVVWGVTTTTTARRAPPVPVACTLAPVPRSTRTTPARPALTATAGRVAVPFTFAALCGRVIGKPALPTARRAPPTAAAATQAARTAAHRAGFDAGRAAERLRLAAILTSPAARWHPDAARALAFETLTPAARAVALLGTLPPPALHPGAQRGQNVAAVMLVQAVADRWDKVMRAAAKP